MTVSTYRAALTAAYDAASARHYAGTEGHALAVAYAIRAQGVDISGPPCGCFTAQGRAIGRLMRAHGVRAADNLDPTGPAAILVEG